LVSAGPLTPRNPKTKSRIHKFVLLKVKVLYENINL
jgi:hypothetical protein